MSCCKVCCYEIFHDGSECNCFNFWLMINLFILGIGIPMTIIGVIIGPITQYIYAYIGIGLLSIGVIPWLIYGLIEAVHKCKEHSQRYEKL